MFISTAFLVALPLVAVPILLHLFDRRRNVVIEWGAMQFLMEAKAEQSNARRLKQWLLVAMRVLALAALVFALAQPLLPASWFGTSKRTETVLILDNSMSMMRVAGDNTLFDQAVQRAVDRVEATELGDSVRILLASPYPIWATTGNVRVDNHSRERVTAKLQELRPTSGRSDLLSALFTAVQTEVDPTQTSREILLLTDGQSSDWTIADEASWVRFRDVLQKAAIPTQLDVVQLQSESTASHNLSLIHI